MKDILLKIKEKLIEISELDTVTIGEFDGDMPASMVNFATIVESEPAEDFEYRGSFARHSYNIAIKVASITPAPYVESAIKNSIDLAKLVQEKLYINRNLDGLVKNIRLQNISSTVGNIGGGQGEEKFARVRVMNFEAWKYETVF